MMLPKLTIVFCFFTASFASSSSDEATPLALLSDALLSRHEAAYPILLADGADKGPGDYDFLDSAATLPNYCRDDDDFACYE